MNINSFKERSTIAEIRFYVEYSTSVCMQVGLVLIYENIVVHRLILLMSQCCSNFHFKYVQTILEFSNYNEKYISNVLGHFYFNVSTFFKQICDYQSPFHRDL